MVALGEEDYERPSMLSSKWKLKRGFGFAVLAFLIGFSAVVMDAVVDAFVFHDGRFLEVFFAYSFREHVTRFQLFAAFAMSGVLVFKSLADRRKAEERLSALNICGRNLNRATNLNEIYELTLAAMELTLGFEYAAFMLVDNGRLVVARQRGFAIPASFELPLSGNKGGLTVRAAIQRRAVLISDVFSESEYVKPSPSSPVMRSEIAVPIIVEDRVLGILNAESKKVKAFGENDVTLLQILASHAGTAIANLKAQEEIRSYTDQLENRVKEKTDELVAAQEKLFQAQRFAVIGELAGMVGHDLRNPLTGMAGATYYLSKTYGSAMDAKGKEMLEIIEKDIEYSNRIINDLLDYSREISLELTDSNPKSIIREVLPTVGIPANIQVLDKTEEEPTMRVDFVNIRRVFTNIIKNAVDAMPSGGKLTVASFQKGNDVTISISDTGMGIPKKILEKLWTPLFTTKAKGMGFGLPICKRIIDAHRGSITIKSIVNRGTTFSVTVPLKPVAQQENGESFKVPRMPEISST